MIGARSAAARSGDPLARAQLRRPRQLLDAGADRGLEHELVAVLVVEIDEAGVGLERLRDLRRDELEQLAQVERRVDGLDRLGDRVAGAARTGSSSSDDRRRAPAGLPRS